MKNSRNTWHDKLGNTPLLVAIALYAIVVLRSAWLAEDAFITFRTVDNFIHGYGLTWNVTERVQGYTNPLWMFLVSIFYFCTREIFYTAIFLSVGVSLLSVFLLALNIAASRGAALLAVIALVFSRAFIDYSTSGLENPLTHLILACFMATYLRQQFRVRSFFWLSLIAALGTLNRMDTILFFLPPLIHFAWVLRNQKALLIALAGFAPFMLWEMFSLFYYGFPFPNTAYAKVDTGIPAIELATQGLYYLVDATQNDPLTPLIVLIGLTFPFLSKDRPLIPLVLGILLYLFYVVRIGGDFMSGRFLTAPFFASTAIIYIREVKDEVMFQCCFGLDFR